MEKIKKIAFTSGQMFTAKESGKFETPRQYVEWCFMKKHRCKVIDHTKLIYDYRNPKQITVHGAVGHAIEEQ